MALLRKSRRPKFSSLMMPSRKLSVRI